MSILKSILHRWNKENKSYDTLHPETEVAQITDFADGIVSKLAATTAISAISALQTDSWFGKMMKWVLDASGVKYLIDTNGYVCFGSLFGGLIIQWGIAPLVAENTAKALFPIAFQNTGYVMLGSGHIDDNATAYIKGTLYNHKETNSCVLRASEAHGPAAEYVVWGR